MTPNNSLLPPLTQIIDDLNQVWTLGSDGAVLLNGVSAGGGHGSVILWVNLHIYILGTDSNWWQWTGTTYTNVGPQQPKPTGYNLQQFVVKAIELQDYLDNYGDKIKFVLHLSQQTGKITPNRFLLLIDMSV